MYGQRVVVETDHMPLLGIIKKPISQISPRLQRMRLRIDPYDYELVYRPGSELMLADTLSRASSSDNDIDVNDNQYVNTVCTVNYTVKSKIIVFAASSMVCSQGMAGA